VVTRKEKKRKKQEKKKPKYQFQIKILYAAEFLKLICILAEIQNENLCTGRI
jgi:hypothetical protein